MVILCFISFSRTPTSILVGTIVSRLLRALVASAIMRMIPNGEMVGGGPRKEVKLLVMDDLSDYFDHMRTVADMYSSSFAIECKLAQDEEDAHRQMESWAPTVVLIDIHLISKTFELIQALTAKGATVVAMSEGRIPQLAETAQSYGAVGCFIKSENPDEIEKLVSFIASVASDSVVSH
jgi:DNA-binding NarL/FixJ family response regulator